MKTQLRPVSFGSYAWHIETFADDWIGDTIAKTGRPYEDRELTCLAAAFGDRPPSGACLDVGAHIGNHALALSRMGFSEVVCIEMVPETCALLRRNLARAAACRWRVIETAASSGEGTWKVAKLPGDTGSTRLLSGGSAETKRIDDLDLPFTSFIKIDVERHEREVLLGAQQLLRRDRPLLMVEIMNDEYAATVALLRRLRYFPARRLGRWSDGGNYLCTR